MYFITRRGPDCGGRVVMVRGVEGVGEWEVGEESEGASGERLGSRELG